MSYEKQGWTNNISSIDENRMNHIENGIYENSVNIENLENNTENSIYYKSGNTITLSGGLYIGAIPYNTAQLIFSIITPKSLKNISGATVNALDIHARGVNGIVVSGDVTSMVSRVRIFNDNCLHIELTESASIAGTRNTPASVYINSATITLT